MGVGVYFLKVFWAGQVEGSVCAWEWASCSVLVRPNGLTIVNNALGWVSKLTRSEECAQVAIFTDLLRVADLLSLTSCVRTYEWLLICHWANDAIFFPSSGGWFEERRGGSRVVTNPTVWVRDRRVSIIDYRYRWRVSGTSFHLYWFATSGGFVRFNKLRYELA